MGMLRAIWRLVIAVPPVWILVLNSLLFSQVGLAEGHSEAIVQCKGNILYKEAKKVDQDALLSSNGLYAEHYDTNGDGKFDVLTLSYTDLSDKQHNAYPVFWIVDLDFDGEPDAVYIDKKGLGKCSDIVLYEDLNSQPYSEEKPMLDRGGKL